MTNVWGDEDSLGSIGSMECFQDEIEPLGLGDDFEVPIVGDLYTDVGEFEFGDEVTEISNARNIARASVSRSDVVTLGHGSCPHSNYLAGTVGAGDFDHGYLGDTKYIIPLHVLPLVAGHSIRRLALTHTQTTVRAIEVDVRCEVPQTRASSRAGSMRVAECLKTVISAMDHNQFVPF